MECHNGYERVGSVGHLAGFIISAQRSGSTLMRKILDTHSQIHAPGELTLTEVGVKFRRFPAILLRWRRIAECWPQARYIFLLRHPMSLMTSGQVNGFTMISWSELRDFHLRFLTLLQEARDQLPGLTVRYEDLTADPVGTCEGICAFLGVGFEPTMVDYGTAEHGTYTTGTGDASDNMLTGRIQPARALPRDEDTPGPLRPICASLGYPAGAWSAG